MSYERTARSTKAITAGAYHGTGRWPISHDCHARHAVGDGLPAASMTSRCVSPRRSRQRRRSAGFNAIGPADGLHRRVFVRVEGNVLLAHVLASAAMGADDADLFDAVTAGLSADRVVGDHRSSRLVRGRSGPPRSPHYTEGMGTRCVCQQEGAAA